LMRWIQQSNPIRQGKFFDLQYAQHANYPAQKVYSYLRYTEAEALLILTNFDANHSQEFEIEIPELAWNMMNRKPGKARIAKQYFPPRQNQKPRIQDKKVFLPANSALVITLE